MLLEVLPLQQRPRERLQDALDERLDELVVRFAPQPRAPVTQVQRVVQECHVVGPDVQADGEGEGGMDAAGGRVQRQLPHGDRHAAGTLVAEAEDALVVGHHDQAHVGVGGVAEQLRDPVPVRGRDPQAPRPPEDVAERLACAPHCWGVHDRQQLLQVLHQQPVEEGLVAVVEGGQPDVALEVVALPAQVLQLQGDLLLDRGDPLGEQPAQAEPVTLLLGEGRVLVQQRARQQLGAPLGDHGHAAWSLRVSHRCSLTTKWLGQPLGGPADRSASHDPEAVHGRRHPPETGTTNQPPSAVPLGCPGTYNRTRDRLVPAGPSGPDHRRPFGP